MLSLLASRPPGHAVGIEHALAAYLQRARNVALVKAHDFTAEISVPSLRGAGRRTLWLRAACRAPHGCGRAREIILPLLSGQASIYLLFAPRPRAPKELQGGPPVWSPGITGTVERTNQHRPSAMPGRSVATSRLDAGS